MAKRDVQLVFKKPEPQMIQPAGIEEVETTVVRLNELLGWFKAYKVDSIELSIEASGKTGRVINLFVSAEGKGGMKVTLKPK